MLNRSGPLLVVWRANVYLHYVYLLKVWHCKITMYEVQRGQLSQPKHILKLRHRHIFWCLNILNGVWKWLLWCSRHQGRLLLRTKWTLVICMNWCYPKYHWKPQTVQAVWVHAPRHIIVSADNPRKSWMGRGHWVTVMSATSQQCFSYFDEK